MIYGLQRGDKLKETEGECYTIWPTFWIGLWFGLSSSAPTSSATSWLARIAPEDRIGGRMAGVNHHHRRHYYNVTATASIVARLFLECAPDCHSM